MPEGLKSKNRILYELVKKGLFSQSYLADKLYGEDTTKEGKKFTTKQATAKYHQKLDDKSNMADEDVFKLYEIITNEFKEVGDLLKELMPLIKIQYENYELNKSLDEKIQAQKKAIEALNKLKEEAKKMNSK